MRIWQALSPLEMIPSRKCTLERLPKSLAVAYSYLSDRSGLYPSQATCSRHVPSREANVYSGGVSRGDRLVWCTTLHRRVP